jgi:hypothetical protein
MTRQKEAAAKIFGVGRPRVCGRRKRSKSLEPPQLNGRKVKQNNRDFETQYKDGKGAGPLKSVSPLLLWWLAILAAGGAARRIDAFVRELTLAGLRQSSPAGA